MSNRPFSTELDPNFERKPDQAHEANLFIVFGSAFVISITGCSLLIYYADAIDSFMNTLTGAIIIICALGIFGIWRAICIVKTWRE